MSDTAMTHKRPILCTGDIVGKLVLRERFYDSTKHTWRWRCSCKCGNQTTPYENNLRKRYSKSCGKCGKNQFNPCEDSKTTRVTATNGVHFFVDNDDVPLVKTQKWYATTSKTGVQAVVTCTGMDISHLLIGIHKGLEIDHIDGNRLNNKRDNLRVCTHQQNQCNQPLQHNNTSGVAGVRYYHARHKYVARIKVSQYDLHLGYYLTLQEATQARNEGMRLMFGEYARMNDVPEAPGWIKEQIYDKCSRHREKAIVSFGA